MNCPWGNKAFSNYLGDDKEQWRQYDATEIMKSNVSPSPFDDILIDVGTGDNFYKGGQLRPESFQAACGSVEQVRSLHILELHLSRFIIFINLSFNFYVVAESDSKNAGRI